MKNNEKIILESIKLYLKICIAIFIIETITIIKIILYKKEIINRIY